MHSKKLLLLSATIGMTWFSCSKSPQSPVRDPASNNPIATNRQNSIAARGGINPANSDNPLDSIGIYHNMAMGYVAFRGQGETKSLSGNVDYANQFMTEKLGSRVPDLNSKLFRSKDVEILLADTSGSFASTIAATPYSKAVKSYFNNLIATLKDTSNPQASDYSFIKANITRLEKLALDVNLLSDVVKCVILTVTSLARYSLFYWNNAFLATVNPLDNPSETNRHWWQWVIIGVADVAGGIVGGAAGAAASTPTLGVSAPVLVTAGAIAGAAGASGGAAAVF
jgi:hypothetical protein